MENKSLHVMLWILCAGLWSLILVDKCGGDDDTTTVTYYDSLSAARYAPPSSGTSLSERSGTKAMRKGSCININRASIAELVALPGIGPVIAGRIIDFREKNGPFSHPADVEKVKGIGPATRRKIEDKICF